MQEKGTQLKLFYSPGFAFIQYDQPTSAENAIITENGSFLAGQRILVKSAEMKSQKHKLPTNEIQELMEDSEPMNKSEIILKPKMLF